MSFRFSRRSFGVNRKPFNRAPGYVINVSLLAKTLLSVPSKKKKSHARPYQLEIVLLRGDNNVIIKTRYINWCSNLPRLATIGKKQVKQKQRQCAISFGRKEEKWTFFEFTWFKCKINKERIFHNAVTSLTGSCKKFSFFQFSLLYYTLLHHYIANKSACHQNSFQLNQIFYFKWNRSTLPRLQRI